VAITGHRGLPEDTERLVADALRAEVERRADADLVGVSCLCDGADMLFAGAVLDVGGSLLAVVPAERYRDGLPDSHHATFDALVARAAAVIRLDHRESVSEAHMDAGLCMLDHADELIAVWDGKPARGYGGTADVVAAAKDRGMPITVVWPEGARRD
jgi:hypothetical protein